MAKIPADFPASIVKNAGVFRVHLARFPDDHFIFRVFQHHAHSLHYALNVDIHGNVNCPVLGHFHMEITNQNIRGHSRDFLSSAMKLPKTEHNTDATRRAEFAAFVVPDSRRVSTVFFVDVAHRVMRHFPHFFTAERVPFALFEKRHPLLEAVFFQIFN
ncbi:MAG: hypothetical protein MPJ81_07365 [Gammaproteobacteria bacterium]|nr:hypothetical protein [Gammaproteobacteria bacterium]